MNEPANASPAQDAFWQDIARRDAELRERESAALFEPLTRNFQAIVTTGMFEATCLDDVRSRFETCASALAGRWFGHVQEVACRADQIGLPPSVGTGDVRGLGLLLSRRRFLMVERNSDDPFIAVLHDAAASKAYALTSLPGRHPVAVRLSLADGVLVELEPQLRDLASELVEAQLILAPEVPVVQTGVPILS